MGMKRESDCFAYGANLAFSEPAKKKRSRSTHRQRKGRGKRKVRSVPSTPRFLNEKERDRERGRAREREDRYGEEEWFELGKAMTTTSTAEREFPLG